MLQIPLSLYARDKRISTWDLLVLLSDGPGSIVTLGLVLDRPEMPVLICPRSLSTVHSEYKFFSGLLLHVNCDRHKYMSI